jgi:hypothetical protein
VNDDACFKPVAASHLPLAASTDDAKENRIQDSQLALSERGVKARRLPWKYDTCTSLPFLTASIRSEEPTDIRVDAAPGQRHVKATEFSADPIAYDKHVVGK